MRENGLAARQKRRFLVFDNGFHTVHHPRASLHWSRAREEHAKIAHRINRRLNDDSIFGYALRTYVLDPYRELRRSPRPPRPIRNVP